MKWLEKIRKKPVAVRQRILLISTISVTAIIVLFWIATLPYRFRDVKQENLAKSLEPFKVIKSVATNAWTDTKATMDNFNVENNLNVENLETQNYEEQQGN